MASGQTHLMVGAFASILLAFVFHKFMGASIFVAGAGVVLGVVSAMFPDIDHPKALPRKVLRGIMPAVVLFVFGYLFFKWRILQQTQWNMILFFAAPVLIILFYQYFIPRHRGATHKWQGLMTMILAAVVLSVVFGGIVNALILITFAVLGFSTHIVLDHV